MKKYLGNVLRLFGYMLGFSLLLYPVFSNSLNQKNSTTLAVDYEQEISNVSQEQRELELKKVQAYNQSLIGGPPVSDPFAEMGETEDEIYQELLSFNGTSMMGYLEIPKIDILLPIYHGVSEAALQSGVGHLKNTSLPVGGKTTHAVLSGHRGLPSAKLFTDLDQMEIGDVFYIRVLEETLAYQVDQILTVEPTQTQALAIAENEDYVTLVTCTPYAVNTHRLLVRGTRVPYEEAIQVAAQIEKTIEIPLVWRALLGALLVLLVFRMILKWRKKKRAAKKPEGREQHGEQKEEKK